MKTTKMEMVKFHLKKRGIVDPKVLKAMQEVDRTIFVPTEFIEKAYDDGALPIGKGQTISQPYIVAFMAQELKMDENSTVMEVGTGCGYNAAVISRIAAHVYSIEIVEWLGQLAQQNLSRARIENVTTKVGDGYEGWPEKAPFDAIVLTAAASKIPEPLKKQLKIGGKLLAPLGDQVQNLIILLKTGPDDFEERQLIPVKFVPMTGEAQKGN